MTSSIPEGSIRRSLARRHQALRRAVALHAALRASAACAAAIVLATVAGLGIQGPGGAWIRLVLVLLACAAFVAWAVRRFARQAPAFDPYLERVEQHFPNVRSWLRNAIDFGA